MWQGTVWIWINRENIDSLVMQAGRDDLEDLPELGICAVEIKQRLVDWAKRIEESSDALTEEEYGEFYDPYTGQPYRNITFAGSAYSPPKSRIKQQ
jgi:hypothetical protein